MVRVVIPKGLLPFLLHPPYWFRDEAIERFHAITGRGEKVSTVEDVQVVELLHAHATYSNVPHRLLEGQWGADPLVLPHLGSAALDWMFYCMSMEREGVVPEPFVDWARRKAPLTERLYRWAWWDPKTGLKGDADV